MAVKAFVSYSHADELALERLIKHLAMLKQDGQIEEWVDQRILAGGVIDDDISLSLDSSGLFLALISPDFLASNYCFDKEMKRALKLNDQGKLRIVPIIVQPCDWKASPLRKFKAIPKDGKPVAEWTNENNAWLSVIDELRRIIERAPVGASNLQRQGDGTTPKYRLKRDFDEVDKAEFRDTAFATIRDYFQSACAEIASIDEVKARFSELGTGVFHCTVVNRAQLNGVSHISVAISTGRHSWGDIKFSWNESYKPNNCNGWFAVHADEYELSLSNGSMIGYGDTETNMTPRAAAEHLWGQFIERAGIQNAI